MQLLLSSIVKNEQHATYANCFDQPGGLACGPIVASYLGSLHGLVVGGIVLGAVGVVKKSAVDRNATLIPDIVPHMGSINRWRHDYTLSVDPKMGK